MVKGKLKQRGYKRDVLQSYKMRRVVTRERILHIVVYVKFTQGLSRSRGVVYTGVGLVYFWT